jgi:hypothetical protein
MGGNNREGEYAMIKQFFSFVLAISFFSISAGVGAQDQVPAPSFKEGDTWQFNVTRKKGIASSTELTEGLYELVFSQGKIKLYQVSGSQKNEIEIRPDGSMQGLLSMVGKSEERQDLKFPFSIGQKWTYEYENTPAGARRPQRRSVEVTVVGLEQVSTPAGSFKAYKLVASGSWGKSGGATITSFFSPETKSVVKRSNVSNSSSASVETELIKFTAGN